MQEITGISHLFPSKCNNALAFPDMKTFWFPLVQNDSSLIKASMAENLLCFSRAFISLYTSMFIFDNYPLANTSINSTFCVWSVRHSWPVCPSQLISLLLILIN